MNFFDQIEPDDCFRTCIANYLQVDNVTDIPNFIHEPDCNFMMWKWLNERGLDLLFPVYDWWNEQKADYLWIGCGMGPRGHRHAVLMRGNEMLHDPHPSHAGLLKIDGACVILEHGKDIWNPEFKIKLEV